MMDTPYSYTVQWFAKDRNADDGNQYAVATFRDAMRHIITDCRYYADFATDLAQEASRSQGDPGEVAHAYAKASAYHSAIATAAAYAADANAYTWQQASVPVDVPAHGDDEPAHRLITYLIRRITIGDPMDCTACGKPGRCTDIGGGGVHATCRDCAEDYGKRFPDDAPCPTCGADIWTCAANAKCDDAD